MPVTVTEQLKPLNGHFTLNNLNTNAADSVRMSNGGGGLRFISRSSSQMGSLQFLQSENPKPSRRQSPDLPHLSMLPSAPFVLSACLVSEISSEVFLILVNSFLLLIALFHVLCWTPKVSVLTVYMNDLFRRRGT